MKPQFPGELARLTLPRSKKSNLILLLSIIVLGAFLRFYKLDWGGGNFFHPDEYHIVISVNQLSFPDQLHPHLFSYGSTTVYLIYLAKIAASGILGADSLSPFLIGRFISALYSTMTIFVVYKISRILFKVRFVSYLSAFIVSLTPGLIQQAHFATPESAITFWILVVLYFSLEYTKRLRFKYLFVAGLALGLSIATKITSLLVAPTVIFAIIWVGARKKRLKKALLNMLVLTFIASFTYMLAFPYSFLDFKGFTSSMTYETNVARGVLPVFYTRSFLKTLPVFFQFKKILPYAIDPATLFMGTVGFISALLISIKKIKSKTGISWFLVVLVFSLYFFPNSFLYAKWTRFVAPTFPFFAIFSIFILEKVSSKNKTLGQILTSVLVLSASVWTIMFFSIYTKEDVRLNASKWFKQEIPENSYILTESGNTLEVPLSGNYTKRPLDFYHLEENPEIQQGLPKELEKADYFIIQSRRIFYNHPRELFPLTSNFYGMLFSGKLGFSKIKTFTSYPKIGPFEIPDEAAEETWSVFDHPVVRIYKKTEPLTKNQYEKLLKI